MNFRTLILCSVACIMLSACGSKPTPEAPRNAANLPYHLQNPLFVERYGKELLGQLAKIKTSDSSFLSRKANADRLESLRTEWRSKVDESEVMQNNNLRGGLISVDADALGELLLVKDTLYFGPETSFVPSADLRIYLTTVVDPREVAFPDETAMDLGPIQSPYGPQAYKAPNVTNPLEYRTAVLYDPTLESMFAFAQLGILAQ